MNFAAQLFAGATGRGPSLVSSEVLVRTQGNGNLTGLVRRSYSDHTTSDFVFIQNAANRSDVFAAYNASGLYGAR